MKGSNSLYLNQATMLLIVNEWLSSQFKADVKATSISQKATGTNHDEFVVQLVTEEPTP